MSSGAAKLKTRVPFIQGTKPSIKNAQLLASTGIPSLDHVIGGGLPIGSIFMIEEDMYGTYAQVMHKYFIAESIVCSHPLLVACQDMKPSQILSEIPAPVSEPTSHFGTPNIDEEMKIAWRYQNMRIVDPSPSGGNSFGHFYDLTKLMEKELINNANIVQWHGEDTSHKAYAFENSAYENLLKTIAKTLKNGRFFISDYPEKRDVLKIAISGLGSRYWFCNSKESTHRDILKFFYCLRSFLRNSYAIVAITVPVENFQNHDAIIERIEHLSDIAIKLESFAGSCKETNPLFKDYHGLLHIKKLPALNVLAPHCSEARDLAFKLRRKKFVIEILHLPPELGDTTQREQDEAITSGGCSSTNKKNVLDF